MPRIRAPYGQIRKAARRYVQGVRADLAPAELAPLLNACAAFLAGRFEMDGDDAYDVALAAWSEYAGQATGCFIDLDVSTPYLLFINDPAAGVRRPVPLADLLKFLGPRVVAGLDVAAAR